MVCMAIEGAMQIEGGNWQIFDRMLKASNATILLDETVDSINEHESRYLIGSGPTVRSYQDSAPVRGFETVVLAAPLQFSGIKNLPSKLKRTPDAIPYVTLHVTLFTSPRTLNALYFNLGPKDQVPTSILTTLPPDELPTKPEDSAGSPGFFSISTLRTVINPETLEKEYLYKIFSPQAITSDFLSGILGIEGTSYYPFTMGRRILQDVFPRDCYHNRGTFRSDSLLDHSTFHFKSHLIPRNIFSCLKPNVP